MVISLFRHCEEQSDAAIYNLLKSRVLEIDCFAAARNDGETLKQVQGDNINKEFQKLLTANF